MDRAMAAPALIFDLDGTLVDSVYQHVLAWHEALQETGIELSVWRIHRRIGMSGGLFTRALLRETGQRARRGAARAPAGAPHRGLPAADRARSARCPGRAALLARLTEVGCPWAIATSGRIASAGPAIAHARRARGRADRDPRSGAACQARPDLFLEAVRQLGVAVEHAVVVGDSVWDMLAAQRARTLGVGAPVRRLRQGGAGARRRLPGLRGPGGSARAPRRGRRPLRRAPSAGARPMRVAPAARAPARRWSAARGGRPWPRSGRRRCSPTSTRRNVYGGAGRPRRVSEPGAGAADRGRGALLRRAAGRRPEPHRARLSALGRGRGEHRPALRRRARCLPPLARDGQGHARCRRRPLPHLVHRHGRPAREQAVGRALRAQHPFARAAPALEGRAARQRLPPQQLDGAHRDRAGRCDHRGLERDPRGRAAPVRGRAGAGPRDPQRHRSGGVPADRGDRCARAPRHRSGAALRPVRRPDHAPEGDHPPGRRDPRDRSGPADRARRRRARHARDRPRDGGAGRRGQRARGRA